MVFTSCSQYQSDDPDQGNPSQTGGQKMSLRIATVGNGTRGEEKGDGVSEKIKSLRIVIISDCFIEYNQKFDYSQTEGGIKNAEGTIHTLERSTVAGNKKFYLIANEESVPEISFENISDEELREIEGIDNLEEGILRDGMSLTEFLEYFVKDKLPAEGTLDYLNSGTGSQFEKLINSAYFCPDLEVTDNTIYLPYTSYYEGIKAANNPEETVAATMYLVPVATKFTFNLYNYRKEKVELKEIILSKINSSNYLFARLHDSEREKKLKGETYPWIEWLQKVAEDTQKLSGEALQKYNQEVGCIENYFLPPLSKLNDNSLSPYQNEYWRVDKLIDKDRPNILKIIRYLPESLNIENIEKEKRQVYKVAFKVHDENDSELFTSEAMEIESLKSLFRDTHVIVNVDMYDSMVEIYCEMSPWNYVTFQGFVKQEEDD